MVQDDEVLNLVLSVCDNRNSIAPLIARSASMSSEGHDPEPSNSMITPMGRLAIDGSECALLAPQPGINGCGHGGSVAQCLLQRKNARSVVNSSEP